MPTDDDSSTEELLGGRYQLGVCIGEGGMARVHRGYDVALGRAVAIKLMRAGVENAGALERARGEMAVLASLSHPSLVTLFDASIAPGKTSYLVMELVDGPTLSAWLDGGALGERDVAHLALDLAEALHVVHAAGIVHRDVKPSNVLLSATDLPGRKYRARLADFGIAYLVDSTRLTTPGTVVGTAAYLAPEQVTGAPPAPPADVYALGLLLLESLTGERAFAQSAGVEALVARVHASPAVPDSVDPAWAALLRRMTALDPADRPTALEVATEISALPVDARPSPPLPLPPLPPAPTMVMDAAPTLAFAGVEGEPTRLAAVAAAASTPVRDRQRPRRRTRRAAVIAGAAFAVAAVLIAGFWLLGSGGGVPAPAATVVTEPSSDPTPSAPAATEPAVTEPTPEDDGDEGEDESGVVPVEDSDTAPVVEEQAPPATAEEDRKAEEERARAAEKAQKAAEQVAEQAAKDAEKAAKGGPDAPGKP
ncbi:serine/threonine-protein kinase [Microbacterium sp. P04]|uniref:serine/threonine-protein kinase n=1 Tax=Microbacterium sp. P04 TaxID=3366947 RepID=UPI003745CBDA